MNLYTLIQETAAKIDHEYQAGVCLGGSPYTRALELEIQLHEFAEAVDRAAHQRALFIAGRRSGKSNLTFGAVA